MAGRKKHHVESAVKTYLAFQGEISCHMGVLLKGDRIIIPVTHRKEMLNFIHQGHFGIDRNKQRDRSSVSGPD